MATEKNYFFVERPVMAFVISIVIVVLGVVFTRTLTIEQYPDITPPVVSVDATYPGANALNVEQSVATPLEQQVNGVDNMLYMKSVNSNSGGMRVTVTFDVGTDPDMNTVLTQNRVAMANAALPPEVTRLGVNTKKSLSSILLLISLYSPDGTFGSDFLGNYAKINIVDRLARIPGVGNTQAFGSGDYSMRVWLKPDIMAKLGVSVDEVTRAIQAQNTIAPGGKLGAEPSPPGTEFTYTLRLPDRKVTEEEFGEIVIRTREDGSQLKLSQIARVEMGAAAYDSYARINAKEGAVIAIYQAPGSSAVEVTERVLQEMDAIAKDFPEDLVYEVSLDTTRPIVEGIKEIINTLIIALILVVIVVYIFLQDLRATMIPLLAIPVSLVGVFVVFPLIGFSINVLSLLGLVLAIGLVVDDAIVVVEAVQQNMEKGLNAKEATNKAMKEVKGPVIATSLVMVAVFLPVAAVSGITGMLYQQFAITVTVSVLISTVNALSLSPALCSLILRPPVDASKKKGLLNQFFSVFNRGFEKSTTGFLGVANSFTRKLRRTFILLGITVGASALIGLMVPTGFMPEEDMGYFFLSVQLPDAASLQRTDELVAQVEDFLLENEEVEYVTSVPGYSMLSSSFSSNAGFLFISLKTWDERDPVKTLLPKLNRKLREFNAGSCSAFGPPAIPGLGNGSGFSIMIQDKSGKDPGYLAEHTQKFISAATERPEIGSAFTIYRANVPQRYVDLDPDQAMRLGVDMNDIYSTMGTMLGSKYVNDFNLFGRVYRVYTQAAPEYRQNEQGLELIHVNNRFGERIPLSSFCRIVDTVGPEFTIRFNMYRAAEVTGSPAEGYSSAEALGALEEVAEETLPADMAYAWNAMSFQEKKASGSLGPIFIFSLFFVYLILAAQYNSWSMPLAVLLGTPLVVLGALLFLWVARQFSMSFELNIFAQISLVMLIAMGAKNAILIVEFAKEQFDHASNLKQAAMDAAKLRFRPILMTAFSFIIGVLPLVFASGANSEARVVMGVALLGGMVVATALGVLIYPALFMWVGRVFKYEKDRMAPDTDLEQKGEPDEE